MKAWKSGLKWFTVFALLVAIPAVPAFAYHKAAPGVKSTPAKDRVVNVPAVPRNIPDLTPYHKFDPPRSPLFDLNNLTVTGDMRVRPEFRTNGCFGGGAGTGSTCTDASGSFVGGLEKSPGDSEHSTNDFFVTQLARLGFNYAISPDVGMFFQPQYSKVMGAFSNPGGAGDPGSADTGVGGGTLFVRQAFMLIRNAGMQNLSVKLGRQLVVWGNHRLLGHFDWANKGFAFDGMTFDLSGKNWDVMGGWLRIAESDAGAGANAPGFSSAVTGTDATDDADLFIAKGVYKPLKGITLEPYWILLLNGGQSTPGNAGVLAPRAANQNRHTFGVRSAWRKGPTTGMMVDGTAELAWQTGSMGAPLAAGGVAAANTSRSLRINAVAFAVHTGVTMGNLPTDPRFEGGIDYASGDGDANTCGTGVAGTQQVTCGGNANTFENLFPTNHIHYGYMDLMAWKNMVDYSFGFQNRPQPQSQFETTFHIMRLASRRDNWYRAGQGRYFISPAQNQKASLGTELDVVYTHFFMANKVGTQLGYGHFFPGEYVTQAANISGVNPVSQDWGYLSIWVNF